MGERLCAFLDDLHVASNPERTVDCPQILGEEIVAPRQGTTERQCGTAEVRSLPTLVVWREQPDSWTLQRECGEGASTGFQKKVAS